PLTSARSRDSGGGCYLVDQRLDLAGCQAPSTEQDPTGSASRSAIPDWDAPRRSARSSRDPAACHPYPAGLTHGMFWAPVRHVWHRRSGHPQWGWPELIGR
ncbi:MAG: hypothetical protein LC808_41945, partial [Actinobacteria bacterium]|nr:hypothetical protein [Actinomycetota bacterium]